MLDTGLSKVICPILLSVFSNSASNYSQLQAMLQIYHITWFCDALKYLLM